MVPKYYTLSISSAEGPSSSWCFYMEYSFPRYSLGKIPPLYSRMEIQISSPPWGYLSMLFSTAICTHLYLIADPLHSALLFLFSTVLVLCVCTILVIGIVSVAYHTPLILWWQKTSVTYNHNIYFHGLTEAVLSVIFILNIPHWIAFLLIERKEKQQELLLGNSTHPPPLTFHY